MARDRRTIDVLRNHLYVGPPAAYSQAVKAAGLISASGTTPLDPTTGAINGRTIREQTNQWLTNISAVSLAPGSSLERSSAHR